MKMLVNANYLDKLRSRVRYCFLVMGIIALLGTFFPIFFKYMLLPVFYIAVLAILEGNLGYW